MPRLSHARLSYVHFLTSLLNRRLSHHFAWERFKNPRLKSRHRNRRKRINYDKEIGIDIISIPSSVLLPIRSYFYLFRSSEIKEEKKKGTMKFHRKNDNFTSRNGWQISSIYRCCYFFMGSTRATYPPSRLIQRKQRSGVALHTRAKFATLRSLLYIHTDLPFARLSGIGGAARGVCNGWRCGRGYTVVGVCVCIYVLRCQWFMYTANYQHALHCFIRRS